MLFEKQYNEILAESISELGGSTRINKLSAGTKARTLLEVLSRKLNESYKVFDLNLARAFISAANGKYLDFVGDVVAMQRLGIVAAGASVDAKAVRFYVESGTFGSINGATNITIPAGTVLSTRPSGEGITYRVTTATVLLAAGTSTYVPVEAVIPGEDSNVGQGVLQYHTFTNYTDTANSTLKVVNDQGVMSGRDLETDTNYRFRITKAVTAAESANRTAVLLAALSVPGVAEIISIPYARGIGTYDVLIKSVTPTVSTSLINAVQASIDIVTAFGVIPKAKKPVETGITFSIEVRYVGGVPATERASIEQAIRNSLTNYVNSLDIAQEFVINEAVQRVLEVDERIKDIGTSGKPFNEISIYLSTKLQDNKIKNTLLKNYIPAADERLIIEPSVAVPITITAV